MGGKKRNFVEKAFFFLQEFVWIQGGISAPGCKAYFVMRYIIHSDL